MAETFGQYNSNKYRNYYGTMFIQALNIPVTISSTGVYQDIEGFSAGTLLGWVFEDGKQLKCVEPGTYLILWTALIQAEQNKSELFIAVKNATTVFPTTRAVATLDKNQRHSLSGFGVGPANANDIARLGITGNQNDDYLIVDAKLTLVRLDG